MPPNVKGRSKSSSSTGSADETVVTVNARNDFYRDRYNNNKQIMSILIMVIVVQTLFNISLFNTKPEVRVVALDADGRAVPVRALTDPVFKNSALNDWVVREIVELNTYDFRNWRSHFQEMSASFTPSGWKQYGVAMEKSAVIDLIESDDVIVSALSNGAPVIVFDQVYKGRHTWKVQFPITVTYEGRSSTVKQDLEMTVVVVRADLIKYKNGLAIEQVVSRER